MNKKSRMYEVNGTRVRTWNPFVGCKFNCSYCYAPEIYKRFSKCEQCKAFTPHFHPERLQQKFKAGETVFVCSMGDISFVSFTQFNKILEVTNYYLDTTFYIQSKNPAYFNAYIERYSSDIGDNIIFGTTIESNYYHFVSIRSMRHISKAPAPLDRGEAMMELSHHKYLNAMLKIIYHKEEPRKYITIEPVLEFSLSIMVDWIKQIAPEFVYVGYLNPLWQAKKLQLPEPPLEKVKELCEKLAKFTEVRLKTMRKGWNEE